MFKSGPHITWTALKGAGGFPACLRIAFPGGVWVVLWGQQALSCRLWSTGSQG